MLYDFLHVVVPQSLVENDCLDIYSTQHVHDVAPSADALASSLIPVFQPLHDDKTLVFKISAHRCDLCVDSDESSFGCL
jgi:hypothetical protein